MQEHNPSKSLLKIMYSPKRYPVLCRFLLLYLRNNVQKYFYEKSIKYLMLVMIPIATGTVFYSLDIIQLIYGHQYDAAASVLSILIFVLMLLIVVKANKIPLSSLFPTTIFSSLILRLF